ncbi:copper homeostasis protein CutC [Melanogaster broomeanus]|nr:copper homeostasis protein CutC [Melanogaster broomeanus]
MAVNSTRARPPKLAIEVCVDSVESALAAVKGGANRIELCSNLGLGGGTTPSIGLLEAVKKAVPNVPIMAMVRPRTGDFVYSNEELNVMLGDIFVFKEHGVQGVVFGTLTASGEIDDVQLHFDERLVSVAAPLEVCFHRAFDMVVDPRTAWETLTSINGITRVLTSGHSKCAASPEALTTLAYLLDSASLAPIDILPGSGINISTIPVLCSALLPHGLKEIHLSGGKWVEGHSAYRREGMGMGVGGAGEWGVWRTD